MTNVQALIPFVVEVKTRQREAGYYWVRFGRTVIGYYSPWSSFPWAIGPSDFRDKELVVVSERIEEPKG